MSIRGAFSTVFLAAAILLASSAAWAQVPEEPAGVAEEVPAHQATTGLPDMNWVGENPEGDGPPALLLIINFAVFAGLIIGFGGPALKRHMESQHTLINDALEEAAKLRDKAQAQLEEYSQRIADVDSEVDKLVADVRADAEAEKERIIEEGRQQAARLKRDAESRIAAEFVRARQEIEQEVVAAAVAAAERILRQQASAKDKSALVDTFISDIQSEGTARGAPKPPQGAS